MPPVRLTLPVKSLSAVDNVIPPEPASRVLLPVTYSAPDWLITPPLLLAVKLPEILPEPSSNAPELLAESAAVANVPKVRLLESVICVAPPVTLTAPVKSLPTLSSVIAPTPASMALGPTTTSGPDWVMAPPLLVACNWLRTSP